jgi:hypothetical protein
LKRVAWFVALYVGGLAAVGTVAYALRFALTLL